MALTLSISQHGRPFIEAVEDGGASPESGGDVGIRAAFGEGVAAGLLYLATVQLQATIPPSLDFARGLARDYLTRLCRTPGLLDAGSAVASQEHRGLVNPGRPRDRL